MMHLCMAGLDTKTSPVEQRELFAFSETQAKALLQEAVQTEDVCGAVLLATCNRTELYLSVSPDAPVCPAKLLTRFAKPSAASSMLTKREEEAAVSHLMEVTCGMHSQIFHEEQIVTQVGQAIELARQCHSADAMLDALFRNAVSGGKYALTHVSVSAVPLSVSYAAVQLLQEQAGSLTGKTCVVVGNGKMGRLAAELLVTHGCRVYMTLRTYHHGETVIPFGVMPIPYEERFRQMETADFVISATRSPHCTILASQLQAMAHKPAWILDLAMPRDVEPTCGSIPGVQLYDLDDFGDAAAPDAGSLAALQEIAAQYAQEFQMWRNYRDSVPYIQELKQLTAQRLLHSTALDAYRSVEDLDELVALVTEKTVDMLMGSMKSQVCPELLRQCCEKIGDRARSLGK